MTNPQTAAPGVALEAFQHLLDVIHAGRFVPLANSEGLCQSVLDNAESALTALLAGAAGGAQPVYLVHTGLLNGGEALYTRHDVCPPLCDAEKLYAAPPSPVVAQGEVADDRELDNQNTALERSYANGHEDGKRAASRTVPAEDYEGVMLMLAEQRAKNSALASLILDNDRAGAVKWASGMTTDGSAIWPDTPPLQAQDAKDADRMRFLAQRGGLVVSVDDVASVELLGGTDSEGEQIVTVYQGPTLRVAVDAAMSGKAPAVSGGEPIDMVLHCPKCGKQHIDAPEDAECDGEVVHSAGWNNPPHKSHLCHGCGHIWRPADIPTNGVQAVKTKGKDDSAPPSGGGVQVDAGRHFLDQALNEDDGSYKP